MRRGVPPQVLRRCAPCCSVRVCGDRRHECPDCDDGGRSNAPRAVRLTRRQAHARRSMRDGGRTFRRFGWPALLLLGACEAPTAPSPAAVMLGGWTYDSPAIGDHAPSPNTGLHVTLAVDSVQ